MVKRTARYVALGCLVLLAAASVFLGWVLGTSTGAGWLLRNLSRWTPVAVEVEEVNGRLAGNLYLENVQVHWPQGTASAREFLILWEPAKLLQGRLLVNELGLTGIKVELPPSAEAPEAEPVPFDFRWPTVSGLPLRLEAEVRKLQVTDLAVRQPDREPLVLDRLQAALAWRRGVLAVSDLTLAAAQGEAEAAIEVGFTGPLLRLEAGLRLTEPVAGADRFALRGSFGPGATPGGVSGSLTFSAFAENRETLHLQAGLGLTGDRLEIRQLAAGRPGLPGSAEIEGVVVVSAPPEVDLRLTLANLDLASETGVTTDLSGTLQVRGAPDDYRGRFDLANRVEGWQGGSLAAAYAGNLQRVALSEMAGGWLDGRLSGEARIGWEAGLDVAGSLQARALDPAVLAPEWSGRVDLDLEGALRQRDEAPLAVSVRGRLLESTLRGQVLSGHIDAELVGEALDVAALELHGDGFDVSAAGKLQERLEVAADIRRMAALVPGASGRLRADGWVRWVDDYLSGTLAAEGEGIAAQGLEIGRLKLAASHQGKGTPFAVRSEFRQLAYQGVRAESATLDLDGTLGRHQARLALRWPQGDAEAALSGGYRQGHWTGSLAQLGAEDRIHGSWQLQEPVDLQISAKRVSFSSLALASSRGERLQAVAELALEPLQGEVGGSWHRLDLAHADPWLSDMQLAGVASGKARLQWLASGEVRMAGHSEISGRLELDDQALVLERALVDVDWNHQGLAAGLDLMLGSGGTLALGVTSDEPGRLGVPETGDFDLQWKALALRDIQHWLPEEMELAGTSNGELNGSWGDARAGHLRGNADLTARLAYAGTKLEISRADARIDWSRQGLSADLGVELVGGGRLEGRIASDQPAGLAVPERGDLELFWQGFDLDRLRPWLPPSLEAAGKLAGQAQGRWLPGMRLDLAGRSEIREGQVEWQTGEDGVVTAGIRIAELTWGWRNQSLFGNLALALEDYGRAEGSFRLPLAARLPTAIDRAGAVRAKISARVQEKGLLSALFPGLVEESRGELALDLEVGGAWRDPAFTGSMSLVKAGGYIPTAGLQLKDLTLGARFAGNHIEVETFALQSGPGRLEGSGSLQLENWQLASYRATLKGTDFQIVNLPELELQASPDLQLEGNPERLKVRGEIKVPAALVAPKQTRTPVVESQDVVLVDAPKQVKPELAMALDVQVRVVLGDHVLVRALGIDARLGGGVSLFVKGPEEVTARGEIHVEEGAYAAYGVKLDITRGNVLFAGGPVDRPTLDILALRKAGEVKAGVRVTGTPRAPLVTLYSEPQMPDTDVLAYMVLGHPLGADGGQAGLLMVAAGALLSRGE